MTIFLIRKENTFVEQEKTRRRKIHMQTQDIHYRHEVKHEISYSDLIAIRQGLRAVAMPDPHAANGKYTIRSLYFDNLYDKALREKVDGVNMREKFRIRYYNADTSLIHLEKKSKLNGLGTKYSANLTAEEVQKIIDQDTEWMLHSDRPLIEELYCKMKYQGLKPQTIVDYEREPYIYGPGNVRVTFDYNIKTGLRCTDFLNKDHILVPAVRPETSTGIILEVKWDAYLPDIIRDVVQIHGRREGAFSKYMACRMYD